MERSGRPIQLPGCVPCRVLCAQARRDNKEEHVATGARTCDNEEARSHTSGSSMFHSLATPTAAARESKSADKWVSTTL